MIAVGFVLAAAVASVGRWFAGEHLPAPMGTLLVNLSGSFLLGLADGASEGSRTVLGVAALGALTTYSTLVVEVQEMWGRDRRRAGAYLSVSVVGGVGLAALGLALA